MCNLLWYILLSINVCVCLITPLCNGSGTIQSFILEVEHILTVSIEGKPISRKYYYKVWQHFKTI